LSFSGALYLTRYPLIQRSLPHEHRVAHCRTDLAHAETGTMTNASVETPASMEVTR
jgi:hypothetical protein